jgi:hypothetical protein
MVPTLSPKRLRVRAKINFPALSRPAALDTEQADFDLSKEDDDESMNSKDSGSSPRYTSGGEEDKANTPVPSTPQMEATRSQEGTSMPPKTTEASALTPRHAQTESCDNDELSRAGPN